MDGSPRTWSRISQAHCLELEQSSVKFPMREPPWAGKINTWLRPCTAYPQLSGQVFAAQLEMDMAQNAFFSAFSLLEDAHGHDP
jgi:hypothetical protein